MQKHFTFLLLLVFGQIKAQDNVKGIHHMSISVNDLEASIAYYSGQIGLELEKTELISKPQKAEKKANIPHISRATASLKGPNGYLEIIDFMNPEKLSPTPTQGPGYTHICFQTPSNNSIFKKVSEKNATVMSRNGIPVDRGYGIQYAYLREANNILLEIEQMDKPKFEGQVFFAHVAIATHNINRLVDFYSLLFNKKPINKIDNIKNSIKLDEIANMEHLELNGAWFKLSNMQLELWQFDSPKTIERKSFAAYDEIGIQKIVLEVEDVGALYKKLKTNGIAFLSEPIKTKYSQEVFLRDPDGNLLMLISFKDKIESIDNLKKLE
jgi:catechol 2,3-dioxygenase-like lactoylglutathione lyase family enzyme